MAKRDRVGAQPELPWDRERSHYYCSDCMSDECIMHSVVDERPLNDVLASLRFTTRGDLYGIKAVLDEHGAPVTSGTASQVWHYLARAGLIRRTEVSR